MSGGRVRSVDDGVSTGGIGIERSSSERVVGRFVGGPPGPEELVRPKSAFEIPKDKTDIYVCYGFDVAAGDRKDIVAFA